MPRKKKTEIIEAEQAKKTPKKEPIAFYHAIGRRKRATARVRLYVGGNGEIIVNDVPAEKYFPGEVARKIYLRPFELTETLNRFKVSVKVEGGGLFGQLEAVVHGVARALEKIDREKYRPSLKKAGLMTRDPRERQRRKAGFAGKSRAKKQSPKR